MYNEALVCKKMPCSAQVTLLKTLPACTQVDCNLKLVGFQAAEDFDAIVSADLFERLKPAPDIFLAAAQQLGVDPRACVVVEDAAAGVQAARAAGALCTSVCTVLKPSETLMPHACNLRALVLYEHAKIRHAHLCAHDSFRHSRMSIVSCVLWDGRVYK